MKQRTRFWTFALVFGCLAGVAKAESLIPLPGGVAGGFVEPEGRAVLLVDGEERQASALVLMDDRGVQGTIYLSPRRVGRGLTVLSDGRILLESEDASTMDNRTQHYDIVELRGNELETSWSWNSKDAFPGLDRKYHGFHVVFSGDGRAWGTGHGSSFSFRETGGVSLVTRKERFHVGRELTDIGKWTIFSPGFVYLDSVGPVVVAPWNKGAYLVHFAENGSPVVRPILFDNGVEEYHFQWQWEERVLWAETSLYWKGYALPDLGVSGMDEEPIWVLDKVAAAPHPERGVVQVTAGDGRYRVEHAWLNPVTEVEVRHASEWYEGESVLMPFGRRPDPREVRVSPRYGVFTSPNGQHAVIVEGRRRADYTLTYRARVAGLQPTTPAPPLEADREAEAAADRELIGKLGQ